MTRSHGLLLTAVCAAVAVALANPAGAALTFVASRADLAGNDYVDWGVLGPVNTAAPNPFSVNSVDGLGMNVSKPSTGPFKRRDQGNGWGGSFAPGDKLIWTWDEPGPIEIQFSAAVQGAGAQIERNLVGLFTGSISAFDTGGNLLGGFSLPGDAHGGYDNSAIFLGVTSDSCNVGRIVFDVDVGQGEDFAINRLDLRTPGDPAVPEPTALFLAAIGLSGSGLGARFLRRRG